MTVFAHNYIRTVEAFGWDGGPSYSTEITEMENKGEKRNAKWFQSRLFATLPYQNITQDMCDYIVDMFEDRMGRWGAFLYFNPLRHSVIDHTVGIGDGVTREFQLAYVSSLGGRERRRNVYALYVPASDGTDADEAPIAIKVNGSGVGGYVIDHDRGKVIFDVAPTIGALITWTGQFSHWVRFDQDRLPFSIDNKSGGKYVVNGDVSIIEVNPPKPAESSSSS